MTRPSWQLLPDLSPEEYDALKADVAERGVTVPVVVDSETGAIVDGHHRVRAFEQLRAEGVRVPDYPRDVRRFASDEERLAVVLALNLARRHLTRKQRAELVASLRRQGWSTRQIADTVKVDHSTVVRDLAIGADAPIGNGPKRVKRRGGGSYPARRPRPGPSIIARNLRDQARAAAALSVLGDEVYGSMDLRRAEEKARRANLQRRRAEAVPAVSEGARWELRSGDFREVLSDIPERSVDAIVCDPPYDTVGVPLYSELSAFAARVLKPGRLCVAYAGKLDLPEVMARLGEHLSYVWTGAVFLPGRHTVIRARMIRARWRPVLMFSAGPYKPRTWLLDTFTSEGRGEKTSVDHPWQQTLGPFVRLVEQVAKPEELVVDPFTGSGTTALSCLATGRRFLGADIDPGAVSLALERLRAFEAGEFPIELPDRSNEGEPA